MGSKKRSARAKQVADFKAQLSDGLGMDDLFAREESSRREAAREREAAKQDKACTSKNRYATRAEAQEVVAWCEQRGTRGLQIYRCSYCNGWHLTSHPWDDR